MVGRFFFFFREFGSPIFDESMRDLGYFMGLRDGQHRDLMGCI